MSATRASGSSLMALAASMLADEVMGAAPLRGIPKKPDPVRVVPAKKKPVKQVDYAELAASIAYAKQICSEMKPVISDVRATMELSRQLRAERQAQRQLNPWAGV